MAHLALPVARHAGQGQLRAVGAAVVHRRDARDAGAAACGWRPTSITSSAPSITRSTAATRLTRGSSSRSRRSTTRRWRLAARTCCRPTPSSRRISCGTRTGTPNASAWATSSASTLEQYAPGFSSSVVARQVLTPLDLERGWGLTGGQIFHGELSLDQFFTMRPLLGFGDHRTPIRGLFLCSSGVTSGDRAHRGIRRKCRRRGLTRTDLTR